MLRSKSVHDSKREWWSLSMCKCNLLTIIRLFVINLWQWTFVYENFVSLLHCCKNIGGVWYQKYFSDKVANSISRCHLNSTKMPLCWDKRILWPSYLINVIPYIDKKTLIYVYLGNPYLKKKLFVEPLGMRFCFRWCEVMKLNIVCIRMYTLLENNQFGCRNYA